MSKELRIGVTGMSTAGEVDDPYAGVNLAAAENPNFVDEMNHWTYPDYYGSILPTDTLPMEFVPDPAITTGCKVRGGGGTLGGGTNAIAQDLIAIPGAMRASLPCNFTASYWWVQVGGSEEPHTYFIPHITWYGESQNFIWGALGPFMAADLHAWQRQYVTALVPATAYYLSLSIGCEFWEVSDMYYTATKLERVSPAPPARNLEAFSLSRDSAGILIGVRDNAAPQFAVSRDADGITLGAWR